MIDGFASGERIRSEAATWVVRLDAGMGSEECRAFEQWLLEDPAHRAAFDQAHDTFLQSGLIRQSPVSDDRALEDHFPSREKSIVRPALAASIAALLLLGVYQMSRGGGSLLFGPPLQAVMLTSGPTAEAIELKDGTKLRLEPSSAIRIDLTKTARRAQLRRGRAELVVSRDRRPFLLMAGSTQTQVREGRYELDLTAGQGVISEAGKRAGAADIISSASDAPAGPPSSASAHRLEFNATPLADVAARANQPAASPTLEIDPRLGKLPVTGVFRSGDTAALARSLAAVFDLDLVNSQPGVVRLQPRKK